MPAYINESAALDIPIVCYFQPVGEGAILVTPEGSRLTAIGQVFTLMKAHQDGQVCQVGDNGDYSTAATLKDGVHSSYDTDREFTFNLKGKVLEAVLRHSDDVTPHSFFEESRLEVASRGKSLRAVLPPHSVALIRLALGKKK